MIVSRVSTAALQHRSSRVISYAAAHAAVSPAGHLVTSAVAPPSTVTRTLSVVTNYRISRLRSVPHALLRVIRFIEHPGSPTSEDLSPWPFYCLHIAEDTAESLVERKHLSLRPATAPRSISAAGSYQVSGVGLSCNAGQWHQLHNGARHQEPGLLLAAPPHSEGESLCNNHGGCWWTGSLQLRASPSPDTADCLVARTKLKLISKNKRSAMCANWRL